MTEATPADPKPPQPKPLTFKVAPTIVEDLGLNLYTSLPRVLAEFVANAYDADSPVADIRIDFEAIRKARQTMREAFKIEKAKAKEEAREHELEPLESRTLPPEFSIVIEDNGDGMTREDLGTKFLIAGRRRRDDDKEARTAKERLVMGRKGLGKLAGFGVARHVDVVSRAKGESHATRIVLSYAALRDVQRVDEVPIIDTRLEDGGGIPEKGTRITLSELLYDPTKSAKETISNGLAEHFEMLRPEEFAVRLNGAQVEPLVREHNYAWPEPELPPRELVDESYETEEGRTLHFKYRMRFTKDSLPGQRRGVRVYARGRLAAAPSLLNAPTGMHGSRMADYLDGVVEATFLDSFAKTDLIATDRQSLRWESPMLSPLKAKLSEAIREACAKYQALRDGRVPGIVKKDPFTLAAIKAAGLVGRNQTLAIRFGTALAKGFADGVEDPQYRTVFPEILRGIGHGTLLSTIAQLAAEDRPDLHRVAARAIQLTHEEMEGFASIGRGRIDAITALRKIVDAHDFKAKKNEKEIQALFEGAPWLVDATYSPTLTANESLSTLYQQLEAELKINKHAPPLEDADDDRPDLAFLLGNEAGGRLVIVELKAPNVPLDSDHLAQLVSYTKRAKRWLDTNAVGHSFQVYGELIGMRDLHSHAKKQIALQDFVDDSGPGTKWRVRTYVDVLIQTQQAHAELLAAHERVAQSHVGGEDEENEDDG